MIHQIYLREFKAFRELRVQFRRLNILVGENNSGKSSILAALRLLAQTTQGRDPSIPLAFDGIFGDFGSYRDLVHGHHGGRRFTIGATVTNPRRDPDGGPRYSFESEFKYRTTRREVVLLSTKISISGQQLLTVSRRIEGTAPLPSMIKYWAVPDSVKSQLRRNIRMYNFIPRIVLLGAGESTSGGVADAYERLSGVRQESWRGADAILQSLARVDYLGAMRRPPERTYVNTGVVGQAIGQDGGNWPGYLALERSVKGSRIGGVRDWLRTAGLAETIDVEWLSDRHYEVRVVHPVSGEAANVADVGQGTSQVLPVIVGGSRLGRGDVFIVEEPEIHLHPRAQASLGDFFVDLVENGVQSFVETHSEYLILRLQQHIASGLLDPADIGFYYVSATPTGKSLQRLELDGTASFRNQIPGGFFPQKLEEANKLALARAKQGELWE